jgi:hypothetical protein
VDTVTQSPQAEVIEGGVSYNHVTIRLTPVQSGKWACNVGIRGTACTANVDGEVTVMQIGVPNVCVCMYVGGCVRAYVCGNV